MQLEPPSQPEAVEVSAKSPASTAMPVSVMAMIWDALSRIPLPFQSVSSGLVVGGEPAPGVATSTSFLYAFAPGPPEPVTPAWYKPGSWPMT